VLWDDAHAELSVSNSTKSGSHFRILPGRQLEASTAMAGNAAIWYIRSHPALDFVTNIRFLHRSLATL
jgi:hypothetical protein